MTALASLDGLGRGYRYRNPLGSLACACDSVPAKINKVYNTDLALSHQGTTAMKDVLTKNEIAFTDNVSTLAVATPNGAVNVPALVPHDQVNGTLASLQTSLQDAQKSISNAVNNLTPQQKQWGKWLLIIGGSVLSYQLFFKKDKGVTVNVGKNLNGPRRVVATMTI